MVERSDAVMVDSRSIYKTKNGRQVEIRNVWADTLEEEMGHVRKLVEKYHFIGMDTEFPGIVAKPILGGDYHVGELKYQELRCNVDLLRIIQLGITFTDDKGNCVDGCPCWQFNFSFNLKEDMYAQDSIDLLARSGIDFESHSRRGIDVEHFGELLISSGLVLTDDIHWVTYSGGYDFGYLLKVLTCLPLPADESEFFKLFRLYFPNVYDTKYISLQCGLAQKGGLNALGQTVDAERVGQNHTAGSDSYLTIKCFFKMKELYYKTKGIEGNRGVLDGYAKYDAPSSVE